MTDDTKALVTAIAELHAIAGGFTVAQAYRNAATYAIRVLEDIAADRDEWKQQHENLLSVRQQDLAALTAYIERLERALAEARTERDALKAALRELVEADHLQQRANAINPLEPGCEKEILRDMAAQKRRTGMHNARALFAAPKEP